MSENEITVDLDNQTYVEEKLKELEKYLDQKKCQKIQQKNYKDANNYLTKKQQQKRTRKFAKRKRRIKKRKRRMMIN